MSKTLLSAITLLLFAQFLGFQAAAQTVGSCHPFPGAVAQDCLQLIGNHLNDASETPCNTNQQATLTFNNCVIVTKCIKGQTSVVNEEAVRRALTAIGSCALNDRGSISGTYTTANGEKTCYLYPGKESIC